MGWNIDRFTEKDKIMDDLMCSVCTDVVQNAVQTPCQHLFCDECIKRWLNEGRRICPVDRQPLTLKDLKPLDRFKKQFLDKFIVKCINHTDGCRLMARFEDMPSLIEHESNQCEAGNGNKIRLDMQQHKNRVSELEEENVGLKEQIAGLEKEKEGQSELKQEIRKEMENQNELWQTISDMVSNQVNSGSSLSTKFDLLLTPKEYEHRLKNCKIETPKNGLASGNSKEPVKKLEKDKSIRDAPREGSASGSSTSYSRTDGNAVGGKSI